MAHSPTSQQKAYGNLSVKRMTWQFCLACGLLALGLMPCRAVAGLLSSSSPGSTVSGVAALQFEQRLDTASISFVGRPYLRSPLGEAAGIDDDPTIRFDAFDCTTYVETVIAVALSTDPTNQLSYLNRIRYTNGQIAFGTRRHLPEFQWLPELIEDAVLRDITQEVGQGNTSYLRKTINSEVWKQQNQPVVEHLDVDLVPSKTIELPYVPLGIFPQTLQRIREIAVLSVVRESRDDVPIIVTHQALLIPSSQGYRVRHARSQPAYQVVDEPVTVFIDRLRRYRWWPVLGLNVADVVDPSTSITGENF